MAQLCPCRAVLTKAGEEGTDAPRQSHLTETLCTRRKTSLRLGLAVFVRLDGLAGLVLGLRARSGLIHGVVSSGNFKSSLVCAGC